jgi:hypothetical protein
MVFTVRSEEHPGVRRIPAGRARGRPWAGLWGCGATGCAAAAAAACSRHCITRSAAGVACRGCPSPGHCSPVCCTPSPVFHNAEAWRCT